MESLEGIVLTPPDRTQILSRATWKLRYLVIGKRKPRQSNNLPNVKSYTQLSKAERGSSGRLRDLGQSSTDDYSISVYKSQDDIEPIHQWPSSIVTECRVESIAPRKSDQARPTLVLTLSDKERKRRSSRAANLITGSKESTSLVLFIRAPSDEYKPSLTDWAQAILARKINKAAYEQPPSPIFSDPFHPRSQQREAADLRSRTGSDTSGISFEPRHLQHKSSTTTYSTATTRDRPLTFSSGSPSLRSKRSDISSPSSSQVPYAFPNQHYTTVLPGDIPSPIVSVPEHAATTGAWPAPPYHKSSVGTASPGRGSITSPSLPSANGGQASSPPAPPRESILDRAFQLRCIPGSEREVPGEEKLSSLARFDALMREADEKRTKREQPVPTASTGDVSSSHGDKEALNEHMVKPVPTDSSDSEDDQDDDEEEEEEDLEPRTQALSSRHSRILQPGVSPQVQRALDFIADRNYQTPSSASLSRVTPTRQPINFHIDERASLFQSVPLRPHTSHSRSRPGVAHRTSSTSQLPASVSMPPPPPPTSGSQIPSSGEGTPVPHSSEKQLSATPGIYPSTNGISSNSSSSSSHSSKRLSFTEFTQRLSSTSNLLLLQNNINNTNNSSSTRASPGSIESDRLNSVSRSTLKNRPNATPRSTRDDHYSWRKAVEPQGGFL